MYFDNLTLAGLLVTLPYIVMLIMFSRVKTAPGPQAAAVPERTRQPEMILRV